jgi:hypothetical protein
MEFQGQGCNREYVWGGCDRPAGITDLDAEQRAVVGRRGDEAQAGSTRISFTLTCKVLFKFLVGPFDAHTHVEPESVHGAGASPAGLSFFNRFGRA